ncbi:hypothetical protein Q5530_36810 [Saccharothrix sp. BKS2]|uniref:hypothetical protein n=1 Tax=Saccharothrix sp. BKS2 TaxID=3064400 RepID=UPI0039ED5C32
MAFEAIWTRRPPRSRSLLFDAVARGLTEDDPTTTDRESSKSMIGTGEIATTMLGSWSITQLRAAAPIPPTSATCPSR